MANGHARYAGYRFALICFGVLAAGCQQQKPVAMTEPLPPPNFGDRVVVAPTAHRAIASPLPPKPVAPPALVAAVAPAGPAYASGIPREWVPTVRSNEWDWIVVHHSATATGGAVRFDKMHRDVHHWDELGYHFVIGNGSDTRDGQVEVGSRWPKQKWGAHAKTADNRFNEHGIGICLVGNFEQTRPTEAQLKSLAKLVAYLQRTYKIPSDHIIGHDDTKATQCPGRLMQMAVVRRMSAQLLADSGTPVPASTPTRTASAHGVPVSRDLLVDAPVR